MKSYVQVLGAGAMDGGGPAVLIFFDDERYLINCGEGLQRFCGEHRIKLGKLSHILLTRLSWDCIGGIPGLISTLADAGASNKLQIVGPRNTRHVIAAMRPFLHRANYAVSINELSGDTDGGEDCYEDAKIKVRVIELSPSQPLERKRRRSDEQSGFGVENLEVISSGNKPDSSANHYLLKMFRDPSAYGSSVPEEILSTRDHYHQCERERMSTRQESRLPPTHPTRSSLLHIIQGPETPGKFLSAVAKSLGVPHGPMNGLLQRGESITLADGSVVSPEMCIGPPTPGPVFIYLDVPTMAHAESLLSKLEEFHSFSSKGSHTQQLKLVIHYVPMDIFTSNLYRSGMFMDWPANTHHVLIDHSQQRVLEASCAMMETLSSQLDPSIYPIPFGSSSITEKEARPLAKYHWISTAKVQSFIDYSESEALSTALSKYTNPAQIASVEGGDVEVTILGTGAALPGKYRNVSATLVTTKLNGEKVSCLFDCGEGTVTQILRSHGPDFESTMASINLLFISHLHADHHAGLLGFLLRRQALAITQKLVIVAPQRYQLWLQEYSECSCIADYTFISCESLLQNPFSQSGLSLLTIPVEHCPRSYACILKTDGGKTIVFSGDTRPCKALINAGMDADILIHEATMGDDLQAEAIAKRHCTISEAITVGRQMNAKHIMLTHFSQRYAKTAPPIPSDAHNVSVAFDLMRVRLSQISAIEGYEYNEKVRALLPEDDPIEAVE